MNLADKAVLFGAPAMGRRHLRRGFAPPAEPELGRGKPDLAFLETATDTEIRWGAARDAPIESRKQKNRLGELPRAVFEFGS